MSNKLIWIDEELYNKLTIINDTVELKNEDIKGIIKQLKDDFTVMDDCLDNDVISFRYHAEKVRNSYKKVVEEEIQKTYELWEQMDTLKSETKNKLDCTKQLTASIQSDVDAIKNSLSNLNLYGVDRLIETIEKFNSMGAKDKELLTRLIEIENR